MNTPPSGDSASLNQLSDSLKHIDLTGHPPVDQWHPKRHGTIDILIKRDGTWLHEGDPFQRERLVNLFAGILWREDDNHYLKTPAEQLLIQVEGTPFFVNSLEIIDSGTEQQQLMFTTSYGDIVVAGANNRLWVEENPDTGEPAPYLDIRYGMKGKLSRNVFYQLADIVEQAPCPPESDIKSPATDCLFVNSQGIRFNLGSAS